MPSWPLPIYGGLGVQGRKTDGLITIRRHGFRGCLVDDIREVAMILIPIGRGHGSRCVAMKSAQR